MIQGEAGHQPDRADELEERLEGGSVSDVVRVGETVRRPTGPWTPTVHALLRHLEDVDFPQAPRVLGVDEVGREILTYVPGTVGRRPWPPVLRTLAGMTEIARLLVRYHEAVSDFVPPNERVWRNGTTGQPRPGRIVSHGDLGPWNTIWSDDRIVGLIDWDFAEPRRPVEDLAEIAWYFVPLQGPRIWRQAGFREPPDTRNRLRHLCVTYGRSGPAEVLDALERRQQLERDRTQRLGAAGIHPWKQFLARGDIQRIDQEARWLADHRDQLTG